VYLISIVVIVVTHTVQSKLGIGITAADDISGRYRIILVLDHCGTGLGPLISVTDWLPHLPFFIPVLEWPVENGLLDIARSSEMSGWRSKDRKYS
jgi:hypothetical protein